MKKSRPVLIKSISPLDLYPLLITLLGLLGSFVCITNKKQYPVVYLSNFPDEILTASLVMRAKRFSFSLSLSLSWHLMHDTPTHLDVPLSLLIPVLMYEISSVDDDPHAFFVLKQHHFAGHTHMKGETKHDVTTPIKL